VFVGVAERPRRPGRTSTADDSKGGTSMSDVNDVRGPQVAEDAQIVHIDAAAVGPVAVEIAVANGPISGLATTPDGGRLLATNYAGNSVSVIDAQTYRIVGTVDGISEPFSMAVADMGALRPDRAYVNTVSTAYDAISVIDLSTNAVVATHPVALSVSDLAVSQDGKRVYISRNGARGADLAVMDTDTDRVEVVDLAKTPGTTTECVRVSPDGDRAYVGVNGPAGGLLVVIGTDKPADADATRSAGRARWRRKASNQAPEAGQQTGLRVLETIAIGLPVRDVALGPNGDVAYVASTGPDGGAVVDVVDTRTNKITGTRKIGEVGGILTGLTLSRDGDRAYLVSDESVTVVCTFTHDVLGALGVAAQPSCVVESPDGKRLYIADYTGLIMVMPIESTAPLAIEGPAHDVSASWVMPDLEPALA
jgi:YVTN family beta-propeller protein